jgi:hypothetical protein
MRLTLPNTILLFFYFQQLGVFPSPKCLQINNKTIIEFGSCKIYEELLRPRFVLSAEAKGFARCTNLSLNNSSYPTRPQSIIVYCYIASANTKRDWLICSHVALDKCNVSRPGNK